MITNVVKIDLCRSKLFAKQEEAKRPDIRKLTLQKLFEVSRKNFPNAEDKYPQGTLYKLDGDAIYYIVEKSSVALRGAIEFMQDWYTEGLPEFPDCRVFIDRGDIQIADIQVEGAVVGKPFENISVFEKSVNEGRICITKEVVDNCDHTMAKFVFFRSFFPRPSEEIKIFYVDCADPRTVTDNSLIHALFIAHPKAGEARQRFFELFLLEYLLEKGTVTDFADFFSWSEAKNYPIPSSQILLDLIPGSDFITSRFDGGKTVYEISSTGTEAIEKAKADYSAARDACVKFVQDAIIEKTQSDHSIENVDIALLVEEYLCAIFSEIRMMANYFQNSGTLFESGPDTFLRYDYILNRRLGEMKFFDEWRTGFLNGLKIASQQNNLFIACVFHNVLGTYYLNRSTQSAQYQIDKLKERQIFIDTNVLYSLLVPASSYYELINQFVMQLRKIGVAVSVFPNTLNEYEHSLSIVVRECGHAGPTEFLLKWNPWLFQQYRISPGKYLNSIDHYCPVKSRTESTGFGWRLNLSGSQMPPGPVKCALFQKA
jgi:hypothetical protein